MPKTYLKACLKDGCLTRWPNSAMPIRVYIAPFRWHEKKKQMESHAYRQFVLEAMQVWHQATDGVVKFIVVPDLHQSQIDFKWRRVDRKSLGHCTYEIDKANRLFSAEISIGISDGILHAQYQDTSEVRHTILHEIGHALGLTGHSDGNDDIMYVPHRFGIHALSERDIETVKWLYTLPVGFNYEAVAQKIGLKQPYDFDDVLDVVALKLNGEEADIEPVPSAFQQRMLPEQSEPEAGSLRSLDDHHAILSEMGRFYLQTQHIQQATHQKLREKLPNWKPPFRKFDPPQ